MNTSLPVFSRRTFLTRGAALISAAGTIPLFLDRSGRVLAADFADNPQGAGRPDRVLVIVQLAGGNDGLNTVAPIGNDDLFSSLDGPDEPRQPVFGLQNIDLHNIVPCVTAMKASIPKCC